MQLERRPYLNDVQGCGLVPQSGWCALFITGTVQWECWGFSFFHFKNFSTEGKSKKHGPNHLIMVPLIGLSHFMSPMHIYALNNSFSERGNCQNWPIDESQSKGK